MGTLIGLDIGDGYIGVSLADESVRIAIPHMVWQVMRGTAEREIVKLIKDKAVKIVVVGLPLGQSGEFNSQCSKIQNFCRRLERRVEVKVVFVDESYSTQEAHDLLTVTRKERSRGKKARVRVDANAATIILQRYLDSSEFTVGHR